MVLAHYIEHGMTAITADGDDPRVRLKMSGIQEAVVFVERRVPPEVFESLAGLEQRIPLLWAMAGPGKGPIIGVSEEKTSELVWRRPQNSRNVRIAGSGHLIVHEKPLELAREVSSFLEDCLLCKARL